jgi:hypothetical protein
VEDAKGIIPWGIFRGHIIAHFATTHCIQLQYVNSIITTCFVTCIGFCAFGLISLKVTRDDSLMRKRIMRVV